ncbi:MAG: GntR family transcriptional regulator [Fibrobacterota bacterium]
MKYLSIYNRLKSDIQAGRYPVQTRLPFVVNLMKQFNAGRCTVQHALNLLTAEGLVKGVRSCGIYVRGQNEIPLFARSGQISRVGILSPFLTIAGIGNSYFYDICAGMEDFFNEHKIRVYLLSCKDKIFPEILKEIHALELDGLCTVDMQDRELRVNLESVRIPVVHTDIYESFGRTPIVSGDNMGGGFMVARRLVELGHHRILFFARLNKRTQRMESMAEIKWNGMVKAIRESPQAGVKKIMLNYNRDDLVAQMRLQLETHANHTGIILIGMDDFANLKKVLEKMPPDRVASLDVAVFECIQTPLYIGRKKVLVCQWDGKRLGRIAAERLLAGKKNPRRLNYVPMWIS